MSRISAWLASARFANLPTIWSHVLAAALVCLIGQKLGEIDSLPGTKDEWQSFAKSILNYRVSSFIIIATGASFLYMAGCLLGDALDRDFDREHRPSRPIPQGILKASTVTLVSIAFFIVGYSMIFGEQFNMFTSDHYANLPVIRGMMHFGAGAPAIVLPLLTIAIVSYAYLHKKSPILGLVLMAACRCFLVLAIATAVQFIMITKPSFFSGSNPPSILFRYAAASACYTIGIVLVARSESQPGRFTKRQLLSLVIGALPLTLVFFDTTPNLYAVVSALLFIAWLAFAFRSLNQNDKPAFVSKALAGFSLLDLCAIAFAFSAVFNHPGPSIFHSLPATPFLAFALGLFCLNLLLQKVTPAT